MSTARVVRDAAGMLNILHSRGQPRNRDSSGPTCQEDQSREACFVPSLGFLSRVSAGQQGVMCIRYQILRRGSRIQGLLQLQYALLTFFTLTRNQTLPSHSDASLPGRITPETRWLTTLRCVNSEVPSRRSQDTSVPPTTTTHSNTHTLSLS